MIRLLNLRWLICVFVIACLNKTCFRMWRKFVFEDAVKQERCMVGSVDSRKVSIWLLYSYVLKYFFLIIRVNFNEPLVFDEIPTGLSYLYIYIKQGIGLRMNSELFKVEKMALCLVYGRTKFLAFLRYYLLWINLKYGTIGKNYIQFRNNLLHV